MLEPKPLEGQQASRETRGVLSVALKIEPGEGRPLAWLVAFSFFAGIVQVSFYAASSALFLSTYSSETIPWVYIASAFVATAAGAIYYRVERRWDSFRLLTGTLLFILLSIAGLRMGLASTNLPWPAFGLLTWFPVISGLMSVIQWTLAGSVFDVRQGKRLFGLVGGGELLASVVGGLMTPFLVEAIGTPNLLWIATGGVVACFLTMSATTRFSNQEHGLTLGRGTSSDDKRRIRFRDLIRSSYIIAIFAVYFMSSTTYQLVDFAFYDQAKDRFADADELARFFGVFFGLSQAVTLLLITVVTGRLMGLMGVHVGKVRRYSLAATLLVTIGYAFWGTVPRGVFLPCRHYQADGSGLRPSYYRSHFPCVVPSTSPGSQDCCPGFTREHRRSHCGWMCGGSPDRTVAVWRLPRVALEYQCTRRDRYLALRELPAQRAVSESTFGSSGESSVGRRVDDL